MSGLEIEQPKAFKLPENKETIASNQEQMRVMTEKIDYLTNKLFGISSEKNKNLEEQYNLFDEA